MSLLEATIVNIKELDLEAINEVKDYQNKLTKPQGSLGILEELSLQLSGITGQKFPDIEKKAVVIMAADHGVVAEGISAYPSEVTPQMVNNFIQGGAAINVLSRHTGSDVFVVDVGVATDLDHPKVLSYKVKLGTENMAQGPAMTKKEAIQALEVGIKVANDLTGKGYRMLATGEMGIGNTTASSALVAAFMGVPAVEVTGKGTGIQGEVIIHKAKVIDGAIAFNQLNPKEPIDVLAKVGGLEIAALAGLILGAAAKQIPVVIDGFISSAAALVAWKIAPRSMGYMISSHCSAEMAHRKLLQYMGLKPVLELEMRLGEGTGAVLAFPLIEAAVKIVKEMATFESAGIAGAND
ncbi:MAG: nicotinate-nucleotide--dimethylbenzimidazole phosphoribosyltransferase [Firmicutes bacterium]|nr:nicotinate-nucleotide--dimethylbenzimidazole phosphoribosyltransferase [Bacillota bacterium]